jgi:hypothetical protein
MAERELEGWVKSELLAGEADELNKNKDRIKKLLRLTPDGHVLLENQKLTARSQIGLYYIGAAYAAVGELRENDVVANKEIIERLGLPEGTVKPRVKELRDGRFIESVEGGHRSSYARVGLFLDGVESEVSKMKNP